MVTPRRLRGGLVRRESSSREADRAAPQPKPHLPQSAAEATGIFITEEEDSGAKVNA